MRKTVLSCVLAVLSMAALAACAADEGGSLPQESGVSSSVASSVSSSTSSSVSAADSASGSSSQAETSASGGEVSGGGSFSSEAISASASSSSTSSSSENSSVDSSSAGSEATVWTATIVTDSGEKTYSITWEEREDELVGVGAIDGEADGIVWRLMGDQDVQTESFERLCGTDTKGNEYRWENGPTSHTGMH